MVWMILAALLPVIVLGAYIYFRDPVKEPISWLLRALIGGIIICIPTAFVEAGISHVLFWQGFPSTLFGTTVQAFFVAAVPEEAAKLLILWLVLRRNPYFDEHFDGIVYAVCVGLGFAAVENVFFVVGEEGNWMGVAVNRALLAVPGHYAFAVLMGYYYSVYRFVDHSSRTAACVLLVPVVAHGVYDALALSGTVNPYVGGIGTIVLIYFCVKMHKFAKTKIVEHIARDQGDNSIDRLEI